MKAHLHQKAGGVRIIDVENAPLPKLIEFNCKLFVVDDTGFAAWGGIPEFGGFGAYYDYYEAVIEFQ